jgi:hypothetical protein
MPDHNDPLCLRNMILAAAQKQIEASDLPAMIADTNSLHGQMKEIPVTRQKRRD